MQQKYGSSRGPLQGVEVKITWERRPAGKASPAYMPEFNIWFAPQKNLTESEPRVGTRDARKETKGRIFLFEAYHSLVKIKFNLRCEQQISHQGQTLITQKQPVSLIKSADEAISKKSFMWVCVWPLLVSVGLFWVISASRYLLLRLILPKRLWESTLFQFARSSPFLPFHAFWTPFLCHQSGRAC